MEKITILKMGRTQISMKILVMTLSMFLWSVDGLFIQIDSTTKVQDSLADHDHINVDGTIWNLTKLSELMTKIKTQRSPYTYGSTDTKRMSVGNKEDNLNDEETSFQLGLNKGSNNGGGDGNSNGGGDGNGGGNGNGGGDGNGGGNGNGGGDGNGGENGNSGGNGQGNVNETDPPGNGTTTTMDPMDKFCEQACEEGLAGPECDCPGHPIG